MSKLHSNRIIQVGLNVRFTDYLDYLSIGETDPPIGSRVRVAFRGKNHIGLVVGYADYSAHKKLQPLLSHLDEVPLIDQQLLVFLKRAAQYYQLTLGQAVHLAIPKWFRTHEKSSAPQLKWWHICTQIDTQKAQQILARAPSQLALFNTIKSHGYIEHSKLTQGTQNTAQLCRELERKNLIEHLPFPRHEEKVIHKPDFRLTKDQSLAIQRLHQDKPNFNTFLLDGITGSGKTEVYIRCIEKHIENGSQILILVPEIGLTPQLFSEINQRISGRVAVLHSGLGEIQRARTWQQAADGELDVLVSTRSGIFTRFNQLGLIIVDEEHDMSFRQQEGIRYSARDLAVLRGFQLNIPVILGSATPSLESLYNAQKKRYQWIKLLTRTNNQELPKITIQDLKSHRIEGGLSKQTIQLITSHLNEKQQVLVFINRRGWAPKMMCHDCSWIAECDSCDAYLTWHESVNNLRCHHCQKKYSRPEFCPSCGSQSIDTLGEGTEKITHTLTQKLGNDSVIRIDRDTVKNSKQWQQKLTTIASGQPCVIVGTQMLAKGHDFPRLSLVVVVNLDTQFFSSDFRSTEHLAQLLIQVSGRAGRAHTAGEVVLQSHYPEHPFFKILLSEGYAAFATEELQQRQAQGFPPHSHMAILRAQHHDADVLERFLTTIEQALPQHDLVSVLGPISATMFIRQKKYRMQLIFNADNRKALHQCISQLTPIIQQQLKKTNVSWILDIDPIYIG